MKRLCFSSLLFMLLLALPLAAKKSAMLYYGDNISYPTVGIHDYIIVQPDHVNVYTNGFKSYRDKIYAYVSVGEAEAGQSYYTQLKPEWMLGENEAWKSAVMDLSSDGYRTFLIEKVITPLHEKGFKHFFFDTMDSYMLISKSAAEKARQEAGLKALINALSARFPASKLIVNRGFEVIPEIAGHLEAVLFESLYYGVNADASGYRVVSEADRNWLLAQAETIKKLGPEVIAVDYLPPYEKAQREEAVAKIAAHGIIPYVGDRHLMTHGASSKNALPREVLVLHSPMPDDESSSLAFTYVAMPLEYMGYIPILHDISQGMPEREDLARYAGVIIGLEMPPEIPNAYIEWIKTVKSASVPLLFLQSFGLENSEELFGALGMNGAVQTLAGEGLKVPVYKDAMFDFEIDAFPDGSNRLWLPPKESRALYSIEDATHQRSTLAAVTPWGGYAVGFAPLVEMNGVYLWSVDPFALFKAALSLKTLMVPDMTTENGKRLLFVHVDGDGIMNRVEWNPELFSGDTLYTILKRYAIPHSISIIQAETAKNGLYPDISEAIEAIAARIFALDYVESATHTFTHPFKWGMITPQGDLDDHYRLKVKGYDFSIDREIGGSLAYITALQPSGKPKANMVFWTGDCLPRENALSYVYEHGILQINGGDTIVTNKRPWISLVSSNGFRRGPFWQIYTAQQNENVYTNNWRGPFWGFKQVIQTFELTDAPRRLKPVNIYYHFYSASKRASIKALEKVYDWASKQDTMPIYTSEYVKKAMQFYDISMALEDDAWEIAGAGELRTLRYKGEAVLPDYAKSEGVAGSKKGVDGTYIHLDESGRYRVVLGGAQTANYLIEANAKIDVHFKTVSDERLRFKGNVPLKLRYNLQKGCQIAVAPKPDVLRYEASVAIVEYSKTKEAEILVSCH